MEKTGDNTTTNKVLYNDLVLETLFDFLDAKDLQSCRLVCSKWQQMSRSFFLKRSKVFITGNKYSDALTSFTETFSGASIVQFTKFCFKGYFPAYKFENFFYSGTNIKELFLESISLADTDGKMIEEYSLNISISLNLKTLSYLLSIDSFRRRTTTMVVRFSQIRSIKNLYLNGPCTLVFDGPICPDEFSIYRGIGFIHQGRKMEGPIPLNDYMDLKNVRKLEVIEREDEHGHLTVDVTDCQQLENLSHNWGTLVGLTPQSKIKFLRISSPSDLSLLPVHLERLELMEGKNVTYTGEVSVNLPHLKRLQTPKTIHLPKFLNCPNLTDLVIGDGYWYHEPVPIPLKVSRMFLNPSVLFRPSNIVHLDYLHLECVPLSVFRALIFLEEVPTQTLVISFRSKNQPLFSKHRATVRSSEASLASLIRIVDLQSGRGGTVALGGIEWDADADCDPFLARVDRKSEFYLFTNGQGHGIDQVEFENMIQLKPDSMFLV